MFKYLVAAFSSIVLFMALPQISSAQSTVVFKVDMRGPMQDSTFVPAEHSVGIRGNQLPFSRTRIIKMRDEAPADSIYEATIRFPSIVNDKMLDYKFVIKKGSQTIEENSSRSVRLAKGKANLPVAGFNEYAS